MPGTVKIMTDDSLKQMALDYHRYPVPGKLAIAPTKPALLKTVPGRAVAQRAAAITVTIPTSKRRVYYSASAPVLRPERNEQAVVRIVG